MPWQPAPIVFPDVELVLSTQIRALLVARGDTDVYVGNAIPSPRRSRMVIFNRDGGGDDGITDTARVRVRCWAGTQKAATDLANLVTALAQMLPGASEATYVRKESGPYEVPDSSEQSQRYLLLEVRTEGVSL